MTEAEWWSATDSVALTEWLFFDALATDRKLRLFCVGCCRWYEEKASEVGRNLLQVVEWFADGRASEEELNAARMPAEEIEEATLQALGWSEQLRAERSITSAAFSPVSYEAVFGTNWRDRSCYEDGQPYPVSVVCLARSPFPEGTSGPEPKVVALLHDIFGPLPFRPITLNPSWLTSTVTSLAQAIYTDRAFDRLPILADALEEAGRNDADVLAHCRGGGEHARGCWVVDCVLGKK